MEQEWTIYGFVNSIKKEYNDVFRNYKRPAMSFQVIILDLFYLIIKYLSIVLNQKGKVSRRYNNSQD